jgi:uncharacterized repeat protein (TIGR01451 family)
MAHGEVGRHMRTLTDVFTPAAPTLPEGLRTLAVSPERELEPGMTVRAEFTFRNQGGAAATGVRVRFNMPEGLVYLVGTGMLDGDLLDDEQGNSPLLSRAGADIGDVAPDRERRIEISYSVAGAIENGSAVEIQAAVAAFELAPVGSNIVRLVARSRPQLENALTTVALESRGAQAEPGSEATITVRVHNAGESSAHDVAVLAPVPEHTSYIANSARVNGREIDRDLPAPFDRVYAPVIAPTLAASATVTLQYRVRIDDPLADGTQIAARAQIASQESAAFALPAATTTVRSAPDFEDDRTAFTIEPSADVTPGSRVLLRLRAHNAGTNAAANATVLLTLPEALIPVRGSVRVDGQPLRERKNAAVYDLGPIPARAAVEFTAEATVASPLADSSQLPVQALLRFDTGERSFERAVSVRSQPHVGSRRNRIERAGSPALHPGEECEAVISISNDGSAAATDAVLHLRVDPALEDVRVFDKSARVELINGCVELGGIEAYASRRFSVRARVCAPHPDRSEVAIAAGLHAQELGEVALGEARWTVDSHPAFSLQNSALTLVQDDVFRPNQLADVYVRLRNDGTDTAQNVRLRLFVSPEARLETVDGATRERSTISFGEIAPGAVAEARLGIRLLRGMAKSHPVTIDSVLTADAMLPVQLAPLTIVTTAEPNFAIGTLHAEPEEIVEAGEELEFVLHVRNSGDGPARRARVSVDRLESLIYVPNSTTVNDLPVRDAGARSPLMDERGLVMSDVDPGIEATVRWREVVNNGVASGETIARVVRISYDGDRVDEIAAREITVRRAPAFGNAVAGLPFGLDGMLRPAFGGSPARALNGAEYMELPPATPVVRAMQSAPPMMLASSAPFDRERLMRAMHFLAESRLRGLVWHLFAIRAFLPDSPAAPEEQTLGQLRDLLRETLDRLFIKLRLPNYVIAPRDLENAAMRTALEDLIAESTEPELHDMRDALAQAPLGTAQPWAALARFIPADGEAMQHYRGLLIAALDELAPQDAVAFTDALQRRPYPVLDAALDVVRAQYVNLPA